VVARLSPQHPQPYPRVPARPGAGDAGPNCRPPAGWRSFSDGIPPPAKACLAGFGPSETRVLGQHGSAYLERHDLVFRKAYYLLPEEGAEKPFDPEKYDDTYRKELLALLKEKAETGKISAPRQAEAEGEVVDLMAALRESVERTKQKGKRKTASKRKAS